MNRAKFQLLSRWVYGLGWFSMIVLSPSISAEQPSYVEFQTFAAWRALVPELTQVYACSLTPAAHELWERDQLRVPASTFPHGDFNQDGSQDWAILLSRGREEGSQCDYVLIVSKVEHGWRRLFLHEVTLEEGQRRPNLLWDAQRQSIGVDFGDRKRTTRPATMTWPSGEGQTGYVHEYAIIRQSINWKPDSGQFEYRVKSTPEEWNMTWGVSADGRLLTADH